VRPNKTATRIICFLLSAVVLVVSAGCVETIVAGSAASFGLGWLVGRLTTPTVTETQCYLNGELVDCAASAP
jgi:hypothetical protein